MARSQTDVQRHFRATLSDADSAVPDGVIGPNGLPDAARFAVYRNNIAFALIDVLKARYPVTCRLIGDACFHAVARDYVRRHPPRSPLLYAYGDDFADFLEPLPPARDVPYLADMVRLENAWNEAYHAAEATPAGLTVLAAVPPERLAELSVGLHPSLRLIVSAWPAASIWHAHQAAGEPASPENWSGEAVMIVRPHAEVIVHRLPPGAATFIEALRDGADFGAAAERAGAANAAFDAAFALVELVQMGAVIQIAIPPSSESNI